MNWNETTKRLICYHFFGSFSNEWQALSLWWSPPRPLLQIRFDSTIPAFVSIDSCFGQNIHHEANPNPADKWRIKGIDWEKIKSINLENTMPLNKGGWSDLDGWVWTLWFIASSTVIIRFLLENFSRFWAMVDANQSVTRLLTEQSLSANVFWQCFRLFIVLSYFSARSFNPTWLHTIRNHNT